MSNDVLAKVSMLNVSVRCFKFGLLGLLPGIGIPFAVVALWMAGQGRGYEKKLWNPARPYRIWGAIFAGIGFFLWGGLALIIMINAYLSS